MSDHAREVRNLLVDARQLCEALGWMADAKRNGPDGLLIRCPSHKDHTPSCGVTKGQDGTLRANCFSCGWTADALGMIALADGLSTSSDFREILIRGAEIGGDLMLSEEIRDGAPRTDGPARTPVAAPEPEPERDYPPQSEVLDLWTTAHPCESAAPVRALLESRAITPASLTTLALGRVLPPGSPVPSWATYGGRPWSTSGHRLICRTVDHTGSVRGVRAWQVDGIEGPKRLPPTGCRATGLVLANREGAKMLAGKSTPKTVVVCEGEPDWLTWATRVQPDVVVFGIGSGSWTKEHASKLPKESSVYIRTHVDMAGEKYAAHVAETIGERCAVWRLTSMLRGVDENDKAKAGKLPTDPADSCEPVNDAARKIVAERPRVLSVQQILYGSQVRAFSTEKPKVLTTGHWMIDMLTGGIRKGQSWVMGADTSWGKSSWAIACADENLKIGARILIVSTEDDESVYGDRLLARRSGVEATRIRDRQLKGDDYSRITEVVNKAESIPVYLDGRGVTWERLLRQMENVVDSEGIDVVVLDYVQEVTTKQKYGDDRLMFKAVGQQFRHAFKTRGIASIMLSQLTIADASKPPTKRDVRECKDLASGAEVVALGWTPQNTITRKNDGGVDEVLYNAGARVLIIDKAKDGKKGSAELEWDDVTASFKRTLRPANEGYDIPGFERADFDDLDNQFADAF